MEPLRTRMPLTLIAFALELFFGIGALAGGLTLMIGPTVDRTMTSHQEMTSLATMLGALPIALALGGSAQSRVSMGVEVIGGLFFSLILTLFVIPTMYTFFSKESRREPTVQESTRS